ncbi:MAG: AAA family ATPase [Hydrogenophaga sp.]|uniref:AAA family ATPase n=1 Tax=Hydrogenophaga sp. TaxID=1904254 RepID=UPI0026282022|nr:AAA family ATPase [Hydrogenophaga sp.]MCV0439820.1 AAA family ATPase [Hydrogenophaga sp.]
MRIIQLHSENVKRVKAVDITPESNVIVISGKNGEGKTSVIDSIWLALEYKAAKKGNPDPLRAGQKNGMVELDLGDYIVKRKFTPSGSTLEIRTPDGSTIKSPQKLLDGMIGDLSFDPWEFSRKSEKDQREMLADVLYTITEGELDLADFDVRHKTAFDARSEINREKKRLASLVTQMAPPTAEDPTEEISVEDLTKAITEAVTTQAKTTELTGKEKALNATIERLQRELAEAQREKETVVRQLEDLPETPDVEFLKGELANIEKTNKRAREVIAYKKTREGLDLVEAEIGKLNDEMELIKINKAEALESSPLPVDNLRITEDGIRVVNEEGQEVPFCQASAAQQLRISLAIAMSANPTLRVIRIADGSLLDDTSMAIVEEMANDEDFQVWIEYASRNEDDRMGVYIEDGTVVEINPDA